MFADDDPAEWANPGDALRVLVVDDARDNAESLAMLLELEGHYVEMLTSGKQALASFDRHAPDVALLDLEMPEVDGYTVARHMRASARTDLMLIAVTGWGRKEDREATRRAGFDLHYTKPVEPARICSALAVFATRLQRHGRN